MTSEIHFRCFHCGTVDFDARFSLRFHNHECCSYNGPEVPVTKWRQLRFWTMATGEDTELMDQCRRR